ncbi:transglutaminase-like domain-containing protein [Limnovirga soli]|uniref:Transglutaminase-like domain-containing protein n=1 Tax=Limnovirga soli TaxID=2656915 RepID=A0A8J8FDL7_9BACT|nr:transglutaminase domain-containing protein [Limnovirga soli]NNV54464.1 hypothetical protein [Limnovirga soli]
MKKAFSALYPWILMCVLVPNVNFAQTESNNISISDKSATYEFVKGTVNSPVLVKEKITTTYKCNGYRTNIPFVEFYDDNTSIENVTVYVNGDKSKDIKPAYSYYSVNDIFYSDARICYLELPLEKKNSESQVAVEKTLNDPRYLTSVYFSEMYTVENMQLVFKVPKWVNIEIKEFNFPAKGITKNIEQNADATIYSYTAKNIGARKNNNYAPGPSYIYPHLLIMTKSAQPEGLPATTYFKNLQEQYNWYKSLVKQIGNDPATFKDKVNEIVKDKKTDAEKIQAVYSWMQANIRYIAFEDGIAGFKPEKAQEVYRRKYGDCKGMANLTTEMLKVLGYDARLCWIGTNHIAYDYSTPSLAVDNHMICALKLNGKFSFLDATEKYIGYGEYAERIQGRQVLIEDGAKYILEKIPVPAGTQNTQTVKQVLKIEAAAITGNVELNYKGESKEYMLFQLNSITQQNRDAALVQYLGDNNNNYKIDNIKTDGLQDWNKDLSIKYDLQYANAVTEFGDEKYIDVDIKKEFGGLNIDTARKQDYLMPYKFHISNITELQLPDGFTVAELPKPLEIKNSTYSFDLRYALNGNKLVYKKELMILNPLIKVNQFNTWNADNAKLNNFYNEQITLKKR